MSRPSLGVEASAGHAQLPAQTGQRKAVRQLAAHLQSLGGSSFLAECATARLKNPSPILSSRFSLGSPDSSTLSSLVSQPCSAWPNPPQSIQACLIHFAKMLLGSPSRWATAVQLGPSVRQSSTASRFCRAVQRSRVLVGLVIDEQSEGHGVTSIDLSTKPGQPH